MRCMLGHRSPFNGSVNVRIAVAAAYIRRRFFLNRAARVIGRNGRGIWCPLKKIRGLVLRRLLRWSYSESHIASHLVLMAGRPVLLVVFRRLYG